MRSGTGRFIIAIIMLLLDWYVFQAIKTVTHHSSEKTRLWIFSAYWIISIASVTYALLFPYLLTINSFKTIKTYAFAIVVGLFFAKLLIALFLMIDDLRRLFMWIASKVFTDTGAHYVENENLIPRSAFLNWLGIGVGTTLFGSLLYGFSNKYNYNIKQVKLRFPNLPKAFNGLKMVQISDIHSGSLNDKNAVNKGIDLILEQQPDIIFFTGDIVNDRATELEPYMEVFSRLKAPLGVYSILGNHDYGDYVQWPSPQVKQQNLQTLVQMHRQMGWHILLNEHATITRNNESIAVIGIENWGAKANFPKYGKMSQAYPGAEKFPFKILLSHDPSHWDAEVIQKYPDIDLMLSGHTHGMQFGVEIPGFKWSPVQYVYKQWAGLYKKGKQHLYVNRGFGFIGYPGRVGILPEITVFTLTN